MIYQPSFIMKLQGTFDKGYTFFSQAQLTLIWQ